MNNEEWSSLSLGELLQLKTNPNVVLKVEEIAVDEKTIKNWHNRGYLSVDKVIKLGKENSTYHTWCGFPDRWNKL